MMDLEKLRQLLDAVQQGQATVDEAMERLRHLPYEDLGYARLDLHRSLRNGLPEVVFCQGKTVEQATAILKRLWEHTDRVMGTRLSSRDGAGNPERTHRSALRSIVPAAELYAAARTQPSRKTLHMP